MNNNNKDIHIRLMFVIAAVFAVSMLAVSVVVEALFDDAEAKRTRSKKSKKDFTLPDTTWIPISLLTNDIQKQLV